MRRFLRSLDHADCFAVLAALAVVIGLEIAKHPDWPNLSWLSRVAAIFDQPPVAPSTAASDLACQSAVLANPATFGQDHAFALRPGQTFDPKQDNGLYHHYLTANFFGAMALGPDGAVGMTSGFAQLHAARAAALRMCEAGGATCHLVADVVPKGQPPEMNCEQTLSFEQGVAFRQIRESYGPRAFARALDGSWGAGTAENLHDAKLYAMVECGAQGSKKSPEMRSSCQIIASWTNDQQPTPSTLAYNPRTFDAQTGIIPPKEGLVSPDARQSYIKTFRLGSYFGAFAQSSDGASGYVTAYANFSDARAAAIAKCKARGGTDCHIVAELRPDTKSTITGGDETLSHAQAKALFYLTKGHGPRAFARARDGAYGSGMGPTLAAARANAIRFCKTVQDHDTKIIATPCEIMAEWPD